MAPTRLAPFGLSGRRPGFHGGNRPAYLARTTERELLVVVQERELIAAQKAIASLGARDPDLQRHAADGNPETQTLEMIRKPRAEHEPRRFDAKSSDPVDERDPRTGERGHMEAVARIVLEIGKVDQRRLADVLVGESQMAGLRGHHRLGAS